MEEKEHKELTSGDNDNSQRSAGHALNTQNAQVPPSLLPTVLQRLGLFSEFSAPEIAADTLIEELHSKDWEERLNAVRALGRLGSSAPVELLTTSLADDDGSVRAAALFALGNAGRRAPLHLLIAALNDSDWHVREVAILALGKQGERVPPEVLQMALHDSDYAVREAATLALQWHRTTIDTAELEDSAVSEGQRWEQHIMQQKESHQNSQVTRGLSNEDWSSTSGISSIEYSSDANRPQRVLREQQQAYAAQSSFSDNQWQSYTPQEPGSGGQMQMYVPDGLSTEEQERVQEEQQQDPMPEPSYEYSGEKVTSLPRQQRRSSPGWWILIIAVIAIVFFLLGGTIMRQATPSIKVSGPVITQGQDQRLFPPSDKGFSTNSSPMDSKFASQARQEIANGLNLSPDDITNQLNAGQSMQDIASAQGVHPDQLHTIELNAMTTLIHSEVKAGNMEDKDAQETLQRLQDNPGMLDKLTTLLFTVPSGGKAGASVGQP